MTRTRSGRAGPWKRCSRWARLKSTSSSAQSKPPRRDRLLRLAIGEQIGAVMDFNNILIGSDDAPRLVDYYTKLFGEPQMSEGGYTGWQLGSGFVTVGPHSEVHGKNTAPGRI